MFIFCLCLSIAGAAKSLTYDCDGWQARGRAVSRILGFGQRAAPPVKSIRPGPILPLLNGLKTSRPACLVTALQIKPNQIQTLISWFIKYSGMLFICQLFVFNKQFNLIFLTKQEQDFCFVNVE